MSGTRVSINGIDLYDRAHVGGWLREVHTEVDQASVLAGDVVDREGCERDAVLHERGLERYYRRVVARFEDEFGAVRVVVRHDVSQACWPMGISVFFTNPSTSV